METFFTNVWADRVQLVALPLEVVGFTLVAIEVFKPRVADSIESFIDKLSCITFPPKDSFGIKVHLWVTASLTILLLIMLSMLRLSISWLSADVTPLSVGKVILMCFAFGIFLDFVVVRLITRTLSGICKTLNYITDGSALGSIGIIIAFFGVLCEVYQFITLLIGKDVISIIVPT